MIKNSQQIQLDIDSLKKDLAAFHEDKVLKELQEIQNRRSKRKRQYAKVTTNENTLNNG